jgi:hypothetical protein
MFFFERSPWYAAQNVGAYPVLRLDAREYTAAMRDATRGAPAGRTAGAQDAPTGALHP